MNKQQIEWARQHDWFIASNDKGEVLVSVGFTHINGTHGHNVGVFNSYKKLRIAAGY